MANSGNKKRGYYCFVPQCQSTTINTPDKHFFFVPRTKDRQKWFAMCRREPGADKTVFSCCEDHFDLENDVSNMIQHRLTGCSMKLKKGVLPSIFHCQPDRRKRAKVLSERPVLKKKRKAEAVASSLRNDVEDLEETPDQDEGTTKSVDKSVQVNRVPMKRSIGTQTAIKSFTDRAIQCSLIEEEVPQKGSEGASSSEELIAAEDSGEEFNPEDTSDEEFEIKQPRIPSNFLKFVDSNPKGYIGVPKQQLHLISFWSKELKIREKNIILTLTKIKTNDPFFRIGDAFEVSQQRASQIFVDTLTQLEACLRPLIFMPKKINKMSLPVAFRANYSKVAQIIDCFEIEIEKPTDPKKQSLTWSDYKKANTLKYLVSCTPNGCVSFISDGFGGRITDKMIVEQCGFVEAIPSGSHVMADRGFKHIEPLLARKDCKLVRPPSLKTNSQFSKEEVHEGKRISSLRIHVERLIRRFREFEILKPHACINHNLIQHMDSIVTICARLINLQAPLIKS